MILSERKVDDFVHLLSDYHAVSVFNPWADCCDLNDVLPTAPIQRQKRLREYLLTRQSSRIALIGEAPGHKGCRYSGIPFVCESKLNQGLVSNMLQHDRFTKQSTAIAEASSTTVWRSLYELGIADYTVLFNAFAWHPHELNDPLTNRTPTTKELLSGHETLSAFLDLIKPEQVVAVGKLASKSLGKLNIEHVSVRHPSMGGATKFRSQLSDLVSGSFAATPMAG